ncbi:MAG TPA: nuclear transport factor 2 family protein [Steroidobacteraceae bacterium]|nr:nuclear transport factor 2 family protein [Steroidobacteraceae bacterium]
MTPAEQIQALQKSVEELTREVGILKDIHAIRRLQHAYGYYIDKCLYNETVDLFADDGEVCFMGGRFKGKEGVKRLYIGRFQKNFTGGKNGPVYGFLLDHPQLQDIIDVAPDRKTAKARARSCMQAGSHESRADRERALSGTDREAMAAAGGQVPRQWWEGGIYENEYVNEGGVWKIKVLNYRPVWHATFEKGWAYTPPEYVKFFSETYPKDPAGPDELITNPKPVLWPDTDVVPFHYPHPVTGRWWK